MTGKEANKRLKKQYKRQNDFIKQKYDRFSVVLPAGTKERFKALNVKPNTIIKELVLSWLDDQQRPDP